MYKNHVLNAWKRLLAHMVIMASISYLATIVLTGLGMLTPNALLHTATTGIRHIGGPIIRTGSDLGLDAGIAIFFCNLFVALLILGLIGWVRLLDPDQRHESYALLRRQLQKDRTAEYLKKIRYFARIRSSQLRLSAFILLCAPYAATITLGGMVGILLGTTHLLSASPLTALAYLLPHGIPEIAALLLACSIPVAMWMSVRPLVDQKNAGSVFEQIGRLAGSAQFQQDLKMIINLLLIAGLIEAHLTRKIVQLISAF